MSKDIQKFYQTHLDTARDWLKTKLQPTDYLDELRQINSACKRLRSHLISKKFARNSPWKDLKRINESLAELEELTAKLRSEYEASITEAYKEIFHKDQVEGDPWDDSES